MNQITGEVFALLSLVVGVAILAVLVSRNSATADVITSGGNAFATILGAATAPVTSGGGAGGMYRSLSF